MTTRTEITPTEQADRVAIRELVDAYAHCADTRDADGQKAVFTEDTHFVVYMDGWGSDPSQVLDTGESYCIAHHLFTEDGERMLMVAWLRYGDTLSRSTTRGSSPNANSTSPGPRLGHPMSSRKGLRCDEQNAPDRRRRTR